MDGLHGENDRPILGLTQVILRPGIGLFSECVKTSPKIEDEPWSLRHTLATNLRRAMDDKMPGVANKAVALSKKTGVGKSTINRYLKPKSKDDSYPTLDKLYVLASELGIGVYELVIDARDMRELNERTARPSTSERVEKVRSLKSR